MAASSQMKKRVKRQTSEGTSSSSSMASPSSIRPKPLACRVYMGRICSPYCAFIALALPFVLCATWSDTTSQGHVPQFYSFDIVNEFPHDPEAFTQGLLYGGNDTLFESTGLYGRSSVRKVDLLSGKVKLSYKMGESLFGEGLTLLGDRLFQVTWLTNIGFTYDQHNISKMGKFVHPMKDGWGLATDGNVIFGSDGSSKLYQLDPVTWKVIKKMTVSYRDQEIPLLNELEYISGEVWANVWQTDCIARISHDSGNVLGWILLHQLRQNLLDSGHKDIDVLNGIAWDEQNKRLFVTGKLWPKLYEIQVRPLSSPVSGNINELCPIRVNI
ncbi:hypothetical protein HPP92_025157 [Vanilla planifolia]|uniref:Glutaminyl-peptide cyclotransferase n=1 Tax=Vanilla planifolia TaxID=51239 RepID=A0A835PJJ8_VANPL|nr:hypothetical protein HPP92_025157 [Vanilla planifolia]